jgi:hypothetical protein
MAASLSAVDRNRSNMENGNHLDIFYQNFRGLRTKSVDTFNNACSLEFNIVCLMETWLNESFSVKNFPPEFMLYIVLIATVILNYVAEGFQLLFLKHFLELNVEPTLTFFFYECVWVEIIATDGHDLFIDIHDFNIDTNVHIIKMASTS